MPSFESEAAFSGYCNAGHQPLTIQQLTLLLWAAATGGRHRPGPAHLGMPASLQTETFSV